MKDINEKNIPLFCIDGDFLLKKMELQEKINIIILDTCRKPLKPIDRAIGKIGTPLGFFKVPKGSFIGYATAPEQTASDGSSNECHSPYTGAIIEELKKIKIERTSPITILKMFQNVRNTVIDKTSDPKKLETPQIPWEATSLINDFFF